MDSRFVVGKDPIRNPKVQQVLEQQVKENYSKTLKLMKVQIAKTLKERRHG